MAQKQTDEDKAKAARETRDQHDAAMRRLSSGRLLRLARDLALRSEKFKPKL